MLKVSDVSEQIRGVSYKPEDVIGKPCEDSIGILRANNIIDGNINFDNLVYIKRSKVSKKQILCKDDIIICASSGSKNLVGKAAQIKFDCGYSFGAFCKVIRPKNINASFLGMYFQSALYRQYISGVSQGANINNIKNEHIDAISIKEYSNSEQEAIAALLEKVAGIISLYKQQSIELDKFVKARFVELFGDIICNSKNWSVHTLDSISSSRLGKMLDTKKDTGKSSFSYLANFNVQWFEFNLSALHEMDFDASEREEFSLRDGDLLITEGGEVGRCAIWHNEVKDCYFQKALHRVRCNKDIILPEYLAWWFKFHSDFNSFEDVVGGKATIAHLPGVKLKKLQIVVPDIDVQKEFMEFWLAADKLKLPHSPNAA